MATELEKIGQLSDDNAAREFSKMLLADFKVRNKLDLSPSVNIYQSLSAHSLLRLVTFTLNTPYGSKTYSVDLVNLIIGGDLETAYVALKKMTPQSLVNGDLFDQDSIDFLTSRISAHLGTTIITALDAVINA